MLYILPDEDKSMGMQFKLEDIQDMKRIEISFLLLT